MSSKMCPLYLANPSADVLGSGPIAVLTVEESESLLGHPVFLWHVQDSVRDGQFQIRRGPGISVFSDCSGHYLLVPGVGGTAPFAIPAEIAVAAGALPPETYERLVATQRSTAVRLRHLTGTLRAQARAIETYRQEEIQRLADMGPDAFLGMMADEAKNLAKSAADAVETFARWIPWIVGGVVLLVVVVRS